MGSHRGDALRSASAVNHEELWHTYFITHILGGMNMEKKQSLRIRIAEWGYRCRNYASFLRGMRVLLGARVGSCLGALTIYGELSAILIKADGTRIDLGVLGRRVVTDVGVAELVDDWDDGSGNIANFNYHDSGTGTRAEDANETALMTQAGPSTRATGTKSQPSANILRSIGTIAYTGTLAIIEHGLFNQSAQGGILWDRTQFSVINVENLDSIQFTYSLTVTAGG